MERFIKGMKHRLIFFYFAMFLLVCAVVLSFSSSAPQLVFIQKLFVGVSTLTFLWLLTETIYSVVFKREKPMA